MERRSFLKCLVFVPVISRLKIATADENKGNVSHQKEEGCADTVVNKQHWVKTADGLVYRVPAKPKAWSLKVLIDGKPMLARKIG